MARAELRVALERAGCVIEPMTEHDLLEVVEIEEMTGLSQWGWDAYRAALEKPEAIMLVARRNVADAQTGRRLGGYIAARMNGDELHVNNIGVWPESRRQGVGGAPACRVADFVYALVSAVDVSLFGVELIIRPQGPSVASGQ